MEDITELKKGHLCFSLIISLPRNHYFFRKFEILNYLEDHVLFNFELFILSRFRFFTFIKKSIGLFMDFNNFIKL